MNDADGTLKVGDYTSSIFLSYLENQLGKGRNTKRCFWLAPEVNLNGMYDLRCDIWTFGCLAYELVTGLPPFWNEAKRQEKNLIAI